MKRKTKVTIAAYAALTVGAVLPLSAAELTHRWSFNGDLADSVGGTVAEKIGENVTTGSGEVSFSAATRWKRIRAIRI